MMEILGTILLSPVTSAVLLFASIFLIVLGASALIAEQASLGRRLAFLGRLPAADAPSAESILLDDGFLKRFDSIFTPTNISELDKVRQRLIQAGYRRPSAVRVYYAAKAGFAFGAIILMSVLVSVIGVNISPLIVAALLVFSGFLGYLLPAFWIERKIQYRRSEAELAFPDMLDMLLICVEAGISIDQATRRVAREIASVSQVMADELGVVNEELYAGKSRPAVFRDFADRLGVPDISAFAAVLRQSDEYGVSIADTLRVYAAELRNKRLMRAEEKANLMPVKLALGSMGFTVPPILLIMAGPSIIMIIRTFAGMGGY